VGEATVAATPDPALASALLPAGGIPLIEGCWSQGLAEGAARSVTFTIRTSGLLLASEGQGYLGRPALNARVDGALGYRLEWTPEADPGAAPAPATEVQLLARKARRRFYPAQYAGCGAGCEGFPGLVDPLAPGPMIAFTPVALRPLARGSALAFTTDAGYQPYARRPSGAVLPVAAAAVDRSALPGGEGKLEIRYYVAYSADEVFVFGPGEASGSAFVIR
jgi:hypothetical protein